MKPFSDACENNKVPILAVLEGKLRDGARVLEIGSGTGQHAVYFGAECPHVTWCPRDLVQNHAGINAWLADAGLANVEDPLVLDVRSKTWPVEEADVVFSANTTHIMDWPSVEAMFRGVARVLRAGGLLVLYGPFRFEGRYTSESNAAFDRFLRDRDPASGIRDFEALDALAVAGNLGAVARYRMPANNDLLLWRRL